MWISSQIRTPTGSSLDASTLEDGEAEALNPGQQHSQRRLAFWVASKEHLGHAGANTLQTGVTPASDEYPVTSAEYYGISGARYLWRAIANMR